VKIHKLTSTEGFIAIDLDDGDAPAVGIVRSAPKILQGGAKELARSLTYTFAVLEQERGGASSGVNAPPDARADALAAFVDEVRPMVEAGTFLPDAGKGVDDATLAGLRDVDPRSSIRFDDVNGVTLDAHLLGVGAAAAASAAVSDLGGKTVAIEGFGASGPALARQAVEWGATVVAVSTTKGSIHNDDGIDPAALGDAYAANGDEMLADLGEVGESWKIFTDPVDVLFAGSKMGAINHTTAANLDVAAVVPWGPIPVTSKAFAVLRKAGAIVVPDFVSTAGPVFAMWPGDDATAMSIETDAVATITELMNELVGHADGPLLAGCYKAEAFLQTWQESLPFGRPLAA